MMEFEAEDHSSSSSEADEPVEPDEDDEEIFPTNSQHPSSYNNNNSLPPVSCSSSVISPTPISLKMSNPNPETPPLQPVRNHHQQHNRTHSTPAKYKECLKNHAVGIGGHAVDGCGEFMPGGPEGSLDALKCAACNCHRNFHRKEFFYTDSTTEIHKPTATLYPYPHHPHLPGPPPPQVFQFYPYTRPGPGPFLPLPAPPQIHPVAASQPKPLSMVPSTTATTTTSSGEGEDVVVVTPSGMTAASKKRFRTKFTPEQKERMFELAERMGWRFQKQDEGMIQRFCEDYGVKRQVLKVWMHNNKNTLGHSGGGGGSGGPGGGSGSNDGMKP